MTEDTDQAPSGRVEDLGREIVSQIRQGLALASHQPLTDAKPTDKINPSRKIFFMDEAHLLPWPRGDFTKDSRN